MLLSTFELGKDNKTDIIYGYNLMVKICEEMQKKDLSIKYFKEIPMEDMCTEGGEIIGHTCASLCYFRHNSIYFEAKINSKFTKKILKDKNIITVPLAKMMAPPSETRTTKVGKIFYNIKKGIAVKMYHIAILQF